MTDDHASFSFLASIAEILRDEFISSDDEWKDSPFYWIKTLPAGTKGKFGIRLISAWCGAKGFRVDTSPDTDADLLINQHRVEIKFSTLWKAGHYQFQQIRDQNYEFLIAIGISPQRGHCWVIDKSILNQYVIGHLPQHTGASGTETFWFSVNPDNPPEWLEPLGGTLESALVVLRSLGKRKKRKKSL